jgi:hypothetical protein
VPEGQQDHRRIPVAGAIAFGRLDQGVDFAGRQVLAGAKLGVSSTGRRALGHLPLKEGGSNGSVFFSWRWRTEC